MLGNQISIENNLTFQTFQNRDKNLEKNFKTDFDLIPRDNFLHDEQI